MADFIGSLTFFRKLDPIRNQSIPNCNKCWIRMLVEYVNNGRQNDINRKFAFFWHNWTTTNIQSGDWLYLRNTNSDPINVCPFGCNRGRWTYAIKLDSSIRSRLNPTPTGDVLSPHFHPIPTQLNGIITPIFWTRRGNRPHWVIGTEIHEITGSFDSNTLDSMMRISVVEVAQQMPIPGMHTTRIA